MPLRRWFGTATPVPGAPRVYRVDVDVQAWRAAAQDLAAGGARLLSLWGGREPAGAAYVASAFVAEAGVLVVRCPLAHGLTYPRIDDLFPAADRLQRAAADLSGLRAAGGDSRPWLRHAAWPRDLHPLARTSAVQEGGVSSAGPPPADDYAFVRVEGDGVHEIAVGPVHAGIIEPGHFRFSVVGEKVLRLEERLGYVHKGIELRFEQLPLRQGHRLAARISGDSAVAFSWAWCLALEGMASVAPPRRALWLRALALELERIVNHLGDLGALGNDAGFAFGLSQFSRLKEQCLRTVAAALGQRYLLDFVVPGGTSVDLRDDGAAALAACLASVEIEAARLRSIYDEHAGVRDRFVGAGIVTPQLAGRLGLAGLAGRASGQPLDLRVDFPCAPYDELLPARCVRDEGDVDARVAVRFDELRDSIRLCHDVLRRLPPGEHAANVPDPPPNTFGVGLVEGWRGPVMIALESGMGGAVARCHPHDPSALNWPVLEHAIIGNIVPDFPLINKSFNLSYSGNDL